MAEIHDQLAAEGVLKESASTSIKGKRAVLGRLYVTKERVVFLKANPLFLSFGAIGGLLFGSIKPKKVELDIPRSAITGVARGTFGRNKNIIEISYGQEKPARFPVKSYEEWAAAIGG